MNIIARKALESSIKHWIRMRDGKQTRDEGPYGGDCALCLTFAGEKCAGCPIEEKTGVFGCYNTPYSLASMWWRLYRTESSAENRKGWKKAANAMIKFLRSLLPKKKKAVKP